MYDYVIVHGSFGNPFGNWAPWLFKQLSSDTRRVLVPHLPGPHEQNFENWSKVMDAYGPAIGENTDIIAHSIAPAFVASWLITRKKHVRNLYFVAPFYGLINIPDFDNINNTFFLSNIALTDLRALSKTIQCIYSNDDPYVPQSMSETFAHDVGGKSTLVQGGKHLNASAGLSEFPVLLELVLDGRT